MRQWAGEESGYTGCNIYSGSTRGRKLPGDERSLEDVEVCIDKDRDTQVIDINKGLIGSCN